jgi:hypothetical protein
MNPHPPAPFKCKIFFYKKTHAPLSPSRIKKETKDEKVKLTPTSPIQE